MKTSPHSIFLEEVINSPFITHKKVSRFTNIVKKSGWLDNFSDEIVNSFYENAESFIDGSYGDYICRSEFKLKASGSRMAITFVICGFEKYVKAYLIFLEGEKIFDSRRK